MTTAVQNPNHPYGTLPDGRPIQANSLEHQLATRNTRIAREAAATAWAKLVVDQPKVAARQFLAVTEYERREYAMALGGDELLNFMRGSKGDLREALIAASGNPTIFRIDLLDDASLPRFVRVANGNLLNAPRPCQTDAAEVDEATARRLTAAGLPVRELVDTTGKKFWKRPGWVPCASVLEGHGQEILPEATWVTIAACDAQVAAMVDSGALRVDAMPADYARGLMRRGEIAVPQ